MKVDKHTRASLDGTVIVCPQCTHPQRVYHFAWAAKGCVRCESMVEKCDWSLGGPDLVIASEVSAEVAGHDAAGLVMALRWGPRPEQVVFLQPGAAAALVDRLTEAVAALAELDRECERREAAARSLN